ncbi:hypothetical protein N7451_006590 [Penicillium sp. IBT 35674x]|nr:hypothetical protein N7451_006590 [Penicillium sp. IBT 35674x]
MVDSGTIHSMTLYTINFISFIEYRYTIKVAKGSIYYIKGYRDVILDILSLDSTLCSLKLIKLIIPTAISAISTRKSPTLALISIDLAHYRVCYTSERKVKYMPYHSIRITLIKGSLKRPYSLYI